jgi:hypothetical protein
MIRCLQVNKAERLSPDDLYMFEFQNMSVKKDLPATRTTFGSPLEQRDTNTSNVLK